MILDFMETDLHKIIYSKNELTDEHIQYFVYQILKGRHINTAVSAAHFLAVAASVVCASIRFAYRAFHSRIRISRRSTTQHRRLIA